MTFFIDRSSGFDNRLVVQGEIHNAVHAGQMYNASYLYTAVVDGGVVDMIISTPATAELHLFAAFGAGGNSRIEIFSSPATVTSAGAAYVPVNFNRHCERSSLSVIGVSGVTTGATKLADNYTWGGSGNNRVGGAGRIGTEWVFDEGSTYVFRLTNEAGKTTACNVDLVFYEVVL